MSIIPRVKAFAEVNDLFEDKALIVGCSGGSDSVALLRILLEITDNKIYVVHVNHQLRESAKDDERFVLELCESLDVPCKVYSFDVSAKASEMKRSLEDTGRILRYQAFEDYQAELFGENYKEKSVICVAHHKDDIAETMLMNLFRGTGAEGLVSPKAKSENVIRPLICVSKSELTDYLDSISQSYVTDATNFENNCTRNIWRNTFIPEIAKVSTKIPRDALYSTYELLADDVDYINSQCEIVFDKVYDKKSKTIDLSGLKGCHKAILSRIIRKQWNEVFGNLIDLEKIHTDDILNLYTTNKSSGTTIDLPFKRCAFVIDGRGGLCNKDAFESFCIEYFENKGFIFDRNDKAIDLDCESINNAVFPQSGFVLCAQIVENIKDLRYNTNSWFYPVFGLEMFKNLKVGRLNGTSIFGKAGSGTHKKINRLLMDKKIPSCIRDKVVGVYNSENVLWIPGIGHSEGFIDEKSSVKFFEAFVDEVPDKYLVVQIKPLEVNDEECRYI